MSQLLSSFTKDALEEVFPYPPLREVAFEIRFTPRLRVNAEIWQLQERLVAHYPSVGSEALLLPSGGTMNTHVFQNPSTGRVLKVSQENFVVAFTQYTRYEDFKAELVERVNQFCSAFQIADLLRVGLRYVNHIQLPTAERTSALLKYVRPLIDFDRVPADDVEQFVTEIHTHYQGHMVTLRGVLLSPMADGRRIYVLDIDCHNAGPQKAERVIDLVDRYHDAAQRFFLDHITEEYKEVLRGRTKG